MKEWLLVDRGGGCSDQAPSAKEDGWLRLSSEKLSIQPHGCTENQPRSSHVHQSSNYYNAVHILQNQRTR